MHFEELKPTSWHQFEKLMGDKGGCGGCWCMLYRISSHKYKEQKYEGNKRAMKKLVSQKPPIGLMAIVDEEPIGWIALSPREDVPRIDNARSLKRIDDKPVWSISCFFVKKEYRGLGVSKALIAGAIAFSKKKKIRTLEAYPSIPYARKTPDSFLWSGVLSAFKKSGFTVIQRNGKTKAIVRLDI